MKYFVLRSIFPLITATIITVSCGGGGGGTDPVPQIPNNPPFFVNNVGEVEVDEMQLSVTTISANDSDGDFRIFDDNLKVVKKITPKKGQAVLFNSNKYHSGSCPINSNIRLNINFVFEM